MILLSFLSSNFSKGLVSLGSCQLPSTPRVRLSLAAVLQPPPLLPAQVAARPHKATLWLWPLTSAPHTGEHILYILYVLYILYYILYIYYIIYYTYYTHTGEHMLFILYTYRQEYTMYTMHIQASIYYTYIHASRTFLVYCGTSLWCSGNTEDPELQKPANKPKGIGERFKFVGGIFD